jgi:hypothetical protein
MLPGMSNLKQKIAAEVRMRELLEQEGLPEPDEIEYGHACIRLIWHQHKLAVVIDLPGSQGDIDTDPAEDVDEAA